MAKKEESFNKVPERGPEKFPEKKKMSKEELEETLIANFISLQKVLTNMSIKFDELSTNITKLLQIFEISAKSFAEKYEEGSSEGGEVDKEFLKKLDSLLDQNKTIAKGIMLMEEKVRERQAATQANPQTPTNYIPPDNFQRSDERFKNMQRQPFR